ncbi:hypothetical protein ACFYXS_05440 [Streptomyces sp. NPDC002574]|uniref:hypothetical protein n=1 Tax=Streptomyces sp. NPDC002574 TaxID=3364652 RepID=UPI0036CA0892
MTRIAGSASRRLLDGPLVRPVEMSADVLDDQLIRQLVDRARASGHQLASVADERRIFRSAGIP